MGSELGQTNMNVCQQTNCSLGVLLHTKIMELILLDGGPWLLC